VAPGECPVNVDTGAFTALRDQVAELAAEVAELRQAVTFTTALGDAIEDRAYRESRESILGRQAGLRPRARHLQAIDGGRL
jgi:hypothetical protein